MLRTMTNINCISAINVFCLNYIIIYNGEYLKFKFTAYIVSVRGRLISVRVQSELIILNKFILIIKYQSLLL